MTDAIVFSKDRPAQLDMLLRSIRRSASWLHNVTVLYTFTSGDYQAGYHVCQEEHRGYVGFVPQGDFRAQVHDLLSTAGTHVTFLCDDDVFFMPLPSLLPQPGYALATNPRLLCFSLRLGANTTECYSMRSKQAVPDPLDGFHWRMQQGDFGYPGSLDGHVFRTEQLRWMLGSPHASWSNPNELEDHLHGVTQTSVLPLMACYPQSVLVGVPVNITNTTHQTNRHAESHRAPLATLNRHFLGGARLDLSAFHPLEVRAAHCEFRLVWEPKAVEAA